MRAAQERAPQTAQPRLQNPNWILMHDSNPTRMAQAAEPQQQIPTAQPKLHNFSSRVQHPSCTTQTQPARPKLHAPQSRFVYDKWLEGKEGECSVTMLEAASEAARATRKTVGGLPGCALACTLLALLSMPCFSKVCNEGPRHARQQRVVC